MSYSLSVAPKARTALAMLETWLAEETLDEIEKLLHDPQVHGIPTDGTIAVYDFVRHVGDKTHYVFLTLRAVIFDEALEVLSLGHFER